jgi:hypothetical protein
MSTPGLACNLTPSFLNEVCNPITIDSRRLETGEMLTHSVRLLVRTACLGAYLLPEWPDLPCLDYEGTAEKVEVESQLNVLNT